MTSISATSASWQQQYSPSQLLQNQLQQDVTSGQISATDQTALASALDSIQTSLQSGGSTAQSASSQPPSPDQLQSKISGLIDAQVSNGTLTSSQATELKDVFQQTFGSTGTSGVHGHHGGGHHHGAPPVDSDGDTDGSSTSASSTTSTSSAATLGSTSATGTTADSTQQLVDQFLQSLQTAQQTSYGASGTAGSADVSALLLNVTI
jgi:hypothetical protein